MHELKEIIRKIERQLPKEYTIPLDPIDLGSLYRIAGALTFAAGKTIYSSISIPVSETNNVFSIYKLALVPYLTEQGLPVQYLLSHKGIAVDKERNRYQLLTEAESVLCGSPGNAYCIIAQPLYSIRENPSCLSSLFMKNQNDIDQLCQTSVTDLPGRSIAAYIFDGAWLITTVENMKLTIVCTDSSVGNKEVSLEKGTNMLQLKKNCKAVSDQLEIPIFYSNSSTVASKTIFRQEFVNMGKMDLFNNPMEYKSRRLPNLKINYTHLPEHVDPGFIENINYWHDKLNSLSPRDTGRSSHWTWVAVAVASFACILVGIGLIWWKIRARGISNLLNNLVMGFSASGVSVAEREIFLEKQSARAQKRKHSQIEDPNGQSENPPPILKKPRITSAVLPPPPNWLIGQPPEAGTSEECPYIFMEDLNQKKTVTFPEAQ